MHSYVHMTQLFCDLASTFFRGYDTIHLRQSCLVTVIFLLLQYAVHSNLLVLCGKNEPYSLLVFLLELCLFQQVIELWLNYLDLC